MRQCCRCLNGVLLWGRVAERTQGKRVALSRRKCTGQPEVNQCKARLSSGSGAFSLSQRPKFTSYLVVTMTRKSCAN
jgi:hypothetical protein